MPAQSLDEIREEFFLGEPVSVDPEKVVAGFAFAREFLGEQWPESCFEGRGPAVGVLVTATGLTLHALRSLARFASLCGRIREDYTSGFAEARVAATFVKLGVEVELTPPLPGTVPDMKIIWDGCPVYVEVSHPGSAKEQREVYEFLRSLGDASLAMVENGSELELFVMGAPTTETQETVLSNLKEMLERGERSRVIREVVRVRFKERGDDVMQTFGLVSPGRFGIMTSRATSDPSKDLWKIVWLYGSIRPDERAGRIVDKERGQLPAEAANLVVLNVSAVPGALTLWPDLVRRRFQPALNRRLGAVVLFEDYPGVKAFETRLMTLENQYAQRPLPGSLLESFDRGLRERFP